MEKQNIQLTTDCVILYRTEAKTKVLLVQRGINPYKGKWALPGGFLKDDEPLEDGAKRELKEETGLEIDQLTQIRAFGTPGRDPRGRTVSIAFYGILASEAKVEGKDDARDARWFELDHLPELAFDHREILDEALEAIFNEGDKRV